MLQFILMDLYAAGLTQTEAKCYATLLEQKDWKPVELAAYVKESRTNCYKILDSLIEKKLAERFIAGKKLHYRATNPSRLLELAREQRTMREKAEKTLESNTHDLIKTFYKTHEQPGVQYFQGQAELSQIYEAIAESSEEVVFINTESSIDFYGFETMHNLKMLAPNNGVCRRALTPDVPGAPHDFADKDPLVLLNRTWLKHGDYTSPVEWGAFEDKVYIISFGKEALGLLIESQQIADSFKELFRLLERGQKLLPGYASLPTKATAEGQTKSHL